MTYLVQTAIFAIAITGFVALILLLLHTVAEDRGLTPPRSHPDDPFTPFGPTHPRS